MTDATRLLSELRSVGVHVTADGDCLHVDAPKGMVTPALTAALVECKAELLTLLASKQDAEAARPLSPSDRDRSEFARAVVRFLRMPLGRFARDSALLEVRVPWWPKTIWFVPGESDVATLVTEGVGRGRIWTARELADLLAIPGITKQQARTIALAKFEFEGEITEVRRPANQSEDDAEEPRA